MEKELKLSRVGKKYFKNEIWLHNPFFYIRDYKKYRELIKVKESNTVRPKSYPASFFELKDIKRHF